MDHITDNNWTENNQYWSRKNWSTVSMLLQQHEMLVERLFHRYNCDFLDISSMFYWLDHAKLQDELKIKGVDGLILKWIHLYLSNRDQIIRIGNNLAEKGSLISGVPLAASWVLFCSLFYRRFGSQIGGLSTILRH